MAGWEGQRPGGLQKTWYRCLVEDLTVFRATEGSTERSPLVFGVDTAVWTVAAKKAGKWYRGVLEEAERFVVKWHNDWAELSKRRHASVVGGAQGNGMGGEQHSQENRGCRKQKGDSRQGSKVPGRPLG